MINPIIIHQPEKVVERTYKGYRERIVESPSGNTEPLPVFVLPPMEQAQTQPPIIVVASPTSPSVERIIYEPARSPERDQETIRNEPAPRARYDPETATPVRKPSPLEHFSPSEVQPVQKKSSPDTQQKELTPDKKKMNEPLKFSPPEQASQAEPRKKLQHKKRNPGRQRKYHQTIAILEEYHGGDPEQFNRLDEQMQRYYRREYPEYFGRDSKRAAEQRLTNRTKAQRTRRESEKRRIAEISRLQRVPA